MGEKDSGIGNQNSEKQLFKRISTQLLFLSLVRKRKKCHMEAYWTLGNYITIFCELGYLASAVFYSFY